MGCLEEIHLKNDAKFGTKKLAKDVPGTYETKDWVDVLMYDIQIWGKKNNWKNPATRKATAYVLVKGAAERQHTSTKTMQTPKTGLSKHLVTSASISGKAGMSTIITRDFN